MNNFKEKEQENQQQRQQNLELQAPLSTKNEQLAGKDHQLQQNKAAITIGHRRWKHFEFGGAQL